MKLESLSKKITIFYDIKENDVIVSKFIVTDETITEEEFFSDVANIEKYFLNHGYDNLHTNPPTYNPYLALSLIKYNNGSRVFAGGTELVRGTDAFIKYQDFLERTYITKTFNCMRPVISKVLAVPVYFTFELNKPANKLQKYMEYNGDGVVYNISDNKPVHNNYIITTSYSKDDLKLKTITIKNKTTIMESRNA